MEQADLRRLLLHGAAQRHVCRNRVIILLSFKAGLRACEIAGLPWSMVLASDGSVADQLSIARCIAKGDSGRSIPMHRQLRSALERLHVGQGNRRHEDRSDHGKCL